MHIKSWLETVGEPVVDTGFPPGEAPPLPYVVFLDTVKRGGGDMRNLTKNHSLTVERYCNTSDDNLKLEALFDAQAIKYTKEKQWLDDESHYMTIYDFDLLEREVI